MQRHFIVEKPYAKYFAAGSDNTGRHGSRNESWRIEKERDGRHQNVRVRMEQILD